VQSVACGANPHALSTRTSPIPLPDYLGRRGPAAKTEFQEALANGERERRRAECESVSASASAVAGLVRGVAGACCGGRRIRAARRAAPEQT